MTTANPINTARSHVAVNARQSMPPSGPNGMNGGYRPPGATAPHHPHIDDVLAFPNDVDRKQPLKHLIELAESALANSEMSRDFGKPAVALRDYVRASIIAIQIIPSHSDYVDLRTSRSDWNQRHSNLLKKISLKSDVYEKIKADIKADNKRTGVRPAVSGPSISRDSVESLSPRSSYSSSTRDSVPTHNGYASQPVSSPQNGSPGAKVKPAVQPKPQSLAGKAIKPGHTRNSSSVSSTQAMSDLAARFANLRGPQANLGGPQSSPGQDPRIKTHQILPAKPAGPRDMPPPRPKISIDSSIPELPKMPDAIYSPARASISGESGRITATTPRAQFSRTGSSASISSLAGMSQQQQSNDYFSSQPQSYSRNGTSGTSGLPESTAKVPEGPTITADDLFQAMKTKWAILIIDVRHRDDFDEGHIMSTSTICVEPSILTRENISADDIADSMVLSPSEEQARFEKREMYDLVVLYDQYSTKILQTPCSSDEFALSSIYRALVHLNYKHELKNRPKLLEGGLDAWVDVLGVGSLQSTTTRKPVQRLAVSHSPFQRRPSQYIGKPLKPDVVKVWQQAVENEEKETETATEQAFHRSTESFLRRYPSLSQQESMTSPTISKQRQPSYGSSHQVDLYTDLPSPPTRPAPALPRPSYSSLSQAVEEHEMYAETTSVTNTQPERTVFTGLNNPRNWCYANSTLQSLLASPGFGKELSNSEWVSKHHVPRKDEEKIEQPQLMMKIISNLFHWMMTGKFESMKAQTLMDYSLHLCQNNQGSSRFGGSDQQDAQEFMSFLFDHLHDETNTRRNQTGNVPQPGKGQTRNLLHGAVDFWRNYQNLNNSIVDRYWRGLELSTVECMVCTKRTHTYSPFDLVFLPVHADHEMTLEQSLRAHSAVSHVEDFDCETCKRKTRAMKSTSFARLPQLLCVGFNRFQYIKAIGDVRKSTTRITWDFNDFDFTPFFLRVDEKMEDKAFSGPFKYECYAVITHQGSRTDNGHYFAYVRDSGSHDPYAWHLCNDEKVTKVRIGSGDNRDVRNQVFKQGSDKVPYLAFFRRKNIG